MDSVPVFWRISMQPVPSHHTAVDMHTNTHARVGHRTRTSLVAHKQTTAMHTSRGVMTLLLLLLLLLRCK